MRCHPIKLNITDINTDSKVFITESISMTRKIVVVSGMMMVVMVRMMAMVRMIRTTAVMFPSS